MDSPDVATGGTTPAPPAPLASSRLEAAPDAASSAKRWRGYSETFAAGVIDGSIGTVVTWATMSASMLVALRMAFAALTLGVVVAVRRDWPALWQPGVRLRLFVCGLALAFNLLSYFIAIRTTGVAVAIFLSYLAPVYVAFVAPHLEGGRTERIVYVSLVVGLAGMALILVPGLVGEGGLHLTAYGLFFAVLAGVLYAVYLIGGKQLRHRQVSGTTIVFAMTVVATVVLMPLGLTHTSAAEFTGGNVLAAAYLGVVCTALTFSLIMDGMHFIRVQHSAILGYIEPVSAPLYALVLLGQRPSLWTIAGGALIIAAGILVVRYGGEEPEPEFHQ
jgi:drug/metabolite transporter (DMT)-like permease